MAETAPKTTSETYTSDIGRGAKAAEAMARAEKGSIDARVAYSQLLVDESKSFRAYVTRKVRSNLKRAG